MPKNANTAIIIANTAIIIVILLFCLGVVCAVDIVKDSQKRSESAFIQVKITEKRIALTRLETPQLILVFEYNAKKYFAKAPDEMINIPDNTLTFVQWFPYTQRILPATPETP